MKDGLTVLLTCKNRERNLSFCLGSIDGNSLVPRTILVDFGSDKSIKHYEKKYPWLTVIRVTRNTKVFHKARAYNIGLRRIATKYMCATDVDQIYQPNFFKTVLDTLKNNDRKVVMCRTWRWKKNLPDFITPDNISEKYFEFKKMVPRGKKLSGEGCCLALSTHWLRKNRGWDERYIGWGPEDSDIVLRARLSKFGIIFITKKTSMIHLPHPKTSKYYSKYEKRNRNLYHRRRVKIRDVMVNQNRKWGQL